MKAPNTPTLCLAAALALALTPVTAFGQGTEEQQQACTPDAVKLCSDTIPDIPKTTACMKAHFSQLSPRCQSAFNDATGGAKTTTKTARKAETRPEPRARTASRVEHPRRIEPAEREPAAAPPDAPETAAVPDIPGYPPFPSPDAPIVRAPVVGGSTAGARAQIVSACRAGLIDSFTCATTVPALIGGPAY